MPTCPVADRAVSIWEEVISFEGPRMVVGMLRSHIFSRSRIKRIDTAVFIDVVNELVHVLVVLMGRNPLKV